MAKPVSVWGLEIGQSALKGLRCRIEGEQVVAEAFDYIEYPKILSQPDSDPETFIREALETFSNRNDLKQCKVALSVPGQSGLAKFFKPPPVELKKIRDIVKYEARQQIPFELDDVIWDYQLMAGGDISDGFALESEVGLFAMKRDAVERALAPLTKADIEIDLLQLAPLSIYNMVTYDKNLAEDESAFNPEHPPKSTIVLAMGTDATDLIVTNGFRVWQRSMPLGGNHFTRQLTKDLKLTYAKAEHLKRNAMEADDPKLVFQAMRPVFNDLVTEIQRSMGFFSSLNKNAEIGSLLLMGNSVKLPGLTQYLSKNLAMDVEVVDGFSRLSGGDDVLSAPAFKDHIASFAPAYGLCLQGLGLGPLQTNLVPQEIVKERLIRSKKPWAVAAAGLLMTGFAASLIPQGSNYAYVHPSKWNAAASAAERTKSTSDSQISEDEKQKNQIDILKTIGNEVSGGGERRIVWMEVVAALLDSVGREEKFDLAALPDPVEVPYSDRTDIHITKLDCKRVEDLTAYLQKTNRAYEDDKKVRLDLLGLLKLPEVDENGEAAETTEEEAPDPLAILAPAEGEESDEQDLSGVVIEIAAFHYHNGEKYAPTNDEREEFVIKTWLHELETGSVKLPDPSTGEMVEFTYKELGLLRPMIIPGTYNPEYKILNPEWVKKHGKPAGAGGGMGGPGMGGPGMGGPGMGGPGMGGGGYGEGDGGYGGGYGEGDGYGGGGYGGAGSGAAAPKPEDDEDVPKQFDAPKFEFKLQIVWRPKLFSDRMEAKKRAAEAAAEAAALEGDLASDETVDDGASDAGS